MKELAKWFELRSNIYKLLSRPFRLESTKEFLGDFHRYLPVFEEYATNYSHINGSDILNEGISLAKQALYSPLPTKELIDEHERVFAAVFLSILNGNSVTPHESVYLSTAGKAMQQERDDVLETYCCEKIRPDRSVFNEPEDHISTELTFISVLSSQTAMAINAGEHTLAEQKIQAQKNFLQNHLCKWVGDAAADIAKSAGMLKDGLHYRADVYYTAIAMITHGYALLDNALLEEFSVAA